MFIIATNAQEKNSKRNVSNKYQQLISFGIDLPTGDFSATHFMGLAVDFTFSKNRFGQLPVIATYRVNIFYNLGIAYYFGKNETVSSFPVSPSPTPYSYCKTPSSSLRLWIMKR